MNKLQTFACLFLFVIQTTSIRLINDNVNLDLTSDDGSIKIILSIGDEEKISGSIGRDKNIEIPDNCDGTSSCLLQSDDITVAIDSIDSGFSIQWQSNNIENVFQDCLNLYPGQLSWYGGPEKWNADWPVENVTYVNRIYTTLKTDNGGVGERYWLNSKGGYVFVEDKVPLYLDQNNAIAGALCLVGSITGPYTQREQVILNYNLVAKTDPKEAHLHAVNNYLGKPKVRPDEWIIRHPIWTTWAKYKQSINDDVVVEFATDVANHGFTGQIEIDDRWETCYGALVFNNDQFSQINNTVQSIKDLGFTVSLWVHPFVNDDCQDPLQYGENNGYFFKSSIDGSEETNWWNGNPARHIDFTNEDARDWFTDRLKLLQDLHGIDSFKFDAGESDFAPPNPVIQGDIEESPNAVTASYVRTCASFGGLLEVRVAWRTQDLGILIRMGDKDSRWGLNNGLHSIITTLIQLNIAGYNFILPDMIGGNGYGDPPTAELIARWTQANTFMPSMQFSYLPWEITSDDFDGLAIVQKFVALREKYADVILDVMDNSIATGNPVNPPIWWADPTNPDALKANDQYMLGEDILVAPVIQEGATSRDIIIPSGTWKDGNDDTIYEGPITLRDYSAPINVLPYFIKQ